MKISPEARALRDWFEARKKERDGYTLKDAAQELSELRGWQVYEPQLWTWIHHGKMGPSTRKFIRENIQAKAS